MKHALAGFYSCYDNRVSTSSESTTPDAVAQDSDSSRVHRFRTAFLDRDGVINRKLPEGEYVSSWQRFVLLPGTAQAIARLNREGLRVVVVTNQRGIALGKYTAEAVREIHNNFQRELADHGAHVDAFYFCPHDRNQCDCRKPLPGMFLQAQRDFPDIHPSTSCMIGDSLSDIEFGRALGLFTVFIAGDPLHRKPGAEKAIQMADSVAENLPDAVRLTLA